MNKNKLLPPFAYFGGKRRVADLVWERLGDVDHYIEPFLGSAAVLLARPHPARVETVNDRDMYVANFWRAVQHDPAAVVRWANNPIFEPDLHARHAWLVEQGRREFREKVMTDPFFFDVRLAGWWVWGLRLTIGAGWCDGKLRRCLPRIGAHGGRKNHEFHVDEMLALADRFKRVRVCCGDWTRICTPAVAGFEKYESIGIFLDPPYRPKGRSKVYTHDAIDHDALQAWVIEQGRRPNVRIALCGYEGDYDLPPEWDEVAWKATGGYGNQGSGRGRANRHRERIWFNLGQNVSSS